MKPTRDRSAAAFSFSAWVARGRDLISAAENAELATKVRRHRRAVAVITGGVNWRNDGTRMIIRSAPSQRLRTPDPLGPRRPLRIWARESFAVLVGAR